MISDSEFTNHYQSLILIFIEIFCIFSSRGFGQQCKQSIRVLRLAPEMQQTDIGHRPLHQRCGTGAVTLKNGQQYSFYGHQSVQENVVL